MVLLSNLDTKENFRPYRFELVEEFTSSQAFLTASIISSLKMAFLLDVVTVRILISGSNDADYIDRKTQWDKILDYIDSIENKENLCITGDFNHGVISERYRSDQARRFFNYQMILESLEEKDIKVAPIDGMSYRGYMKIDHLCTSDKLMVLEAEYLDVFGEHRIIGVPDHSLIVARVAA